MAKQLSGKRVLIDKANSRTVIMTSVAAFILVFCLIATKTLVSQATYQNRVISAKRQTLKQLKANITASSSLQDAYTKFTSTSTNALGGSPTGTGAQDGDNTKIVLDALPSSYDFPALANSLEAMLQTQKVQINSITGTDDEVNQANNNTSASPVPVPIPFQIAVAGDYSAIQGLISELEHSIRPIQVQTMQVSGNQGQLTLVLSAQTFYQPAKTLNISSEVVK